MGSLKVALKVMLADMMDAMTEQVKEYKMDSTKDRLWDKSALHLDTVLVPLSVPCLEQLRARMMDSKRVP